MSNGARWSDKEDEVLKHRWLNTNTPAAFLLPGRSGYACCRRALRLRLGKRLLVTERMKVFVRQTKEAREPVFVLRAQDIFAPHLVRAWILMAKAVACSPSKLAAAEIIAQEMEAWPTKKYPD